MVGGDAREDQDAVRGPVARRGCERPLVRSPEDVARTLSTAEQRVVRRLASESVGVGGDNAISLTQVLDGIIPRHRDASKAALEDLTEKRVIELFGDAWVAFTAFGFQVGAHLARATAQRVRSESPLPFPIENPKDRDWRVHPDFLSQIKITTKDGRLREALQSAMSKVLTLPPDRFGKKKAHGRYGGLFGCHVLKNYRLLWDYEGAVVEFRAFIRKDDPRYAE